MPVSWKGTLQQYAGRLHREHAAKTDVRMIDFVDAAHPALLRMWEKRKRGYRAMGYRIAEPSACHHTQLAYTEPMKLVFLETPLFTRLLGDYLTDESYRELQRALMENPEMGDVMPGTGGFRKVRWEDARRGKGKRGGLRIIYYYLTADHQIWLFTLYDKDEAADLTAEEKKVLKKAIQAELEARRRKP
jgi:superfamily II DNA or RNA helicase